MKNTCIHRAIGAAVLSAALLLALAPKGRATLTYTVGINTSPLVSNTNGLFSLDFQLSSGSTFADSDNTVTLSNFIFSGGSAGAISYTSGGESGSMASTVTLTTSDPQDNELAQYFSAGTTSITFNVSETNNTDNPFDDQFAVSLLDGGLNNVTTTDPNGGNTLVLSNLSTGETLASVGAYQTNGTEAPGVTAVVPEPASIATVLLGAASLLAWGAKRRRSIGS
jgi:hypothetical protein